MSSTLVSLLPIPRQQFFSASGIPLAGGFVYTYLAGTSTPAATYLDYTGTSLNTNPITLDAGGFASIWIPAGPIDVAVFNSSMVQQYKVLGVTALPSVVASLTAGYFQSSTVNPALSGTLRLANTDFIAWRNGGNSADDILSIDTAGQLFWQGNQIPSLSSSPHDPQTWIGPNIFAGLAWYDDLGTFLGTFNQSNTSPRNYLFPDVSGTVALNNAAVLINPQLNGVTINGAPSGPNQALISTSPTAAAWGVGAIQDYDTYTGFSFVNVPPPFTQVVATIPTGGLQQANLVGSYIEGELLINNVAYTGSTPGFALNFNGGAIGSFTLAASTSYDVRFTVALSSSRLPQGEMNVLSSAPAVIASIYNSTAIPAATGTTAVPVSFTITAATSVTMSVQFVHVRVRF